MQPNIVYTKHRKTCFCVSTWSRDLSPTMTNMERWRFLTPFSMRVLMRSSTFILILLITKTEISRRIDRIRSLWSYYTEFLLQEWIILTISREKSKNCGFGFSFDYLFLCLVTKGLGFTWLLGKFRRYGLNRLFSVKLGRTVRIGYGLYLDQYCWTLSLWTTHVNMDFTSMRVHQWVPI